MSKKKVLAFGDSIIRGVTVPDNGTYNISDDNFVQKCEDRLGVEVENFSRFGCTVSKGLDIIERQSSKLNEAGFAILGWGGNDCAFNWEEVAADPEAEHKPKTSLAEFNRIYKEIIRKVSAAGVTPIMLSLPPVNSNLYFDDVTRKMKGSDKKNILRWLGGTTEYIQSWHELYNLEIFKVASELGVNVVDITSSFLAKRNYGHYLCLDGIHPNEKGHQLIADTLCEYCAALV